MKAITLYEPWASLMAIGAKANETRGSRTAHRGDICIHAAKADVGFSDVLAVAAISAFRSRGFNFHLNFGCIVAVVEIWDVQPSEAFTFQGMDKMFLQIPLTSEEKVFGNYAPGRFIYRTRNLRRLKTPVPCRGFQCVGWTVPADVEAKIKLQL